MDIEATTEDDVQEDFPTLQPDSTQDLQQTNTGGGLQWHNITKFPDDKENELKKHCESDFKIANEESSVDGEDGEDEKTEKQGEKRPFSPGSAEHGGGEEKKLKGNEDADKVPQLDGIVDEEDNGQDCGVLTLEDVMKFPEKGDCEVCGKEGSRCRGCYMIHYCGTLCQKKDWSNHKLFCTDVKKQISGPRRKKGGGEGGAVES